MGAIADEKGRRIRRRATSIVVRDQRTLLLREPDDTLFQLPGGGVERGELPICAASRELHEETGLMATGLEYLFDYCDFWGGETEYWGQVQHVFRVAAGGEVTLTTEHSEFAWWDGVEELPVVEYVRPMLCMLSRSE